ncbi:MAG TPA: hypothetical protein VGC32_10385 [Solirubrobacterales bacterium]
MKSEHNDTQTIGLAGLLIGLVSLMVSLHLGGYVVSPWPAPVSA